jgi:uncharacterized protein
VRYLTANIAEDLQRRMVFIAGPRQAGKTTLVKSFLKEFKPGTYINYDNPDGRIAFMDRTWQETDKIIILDEIHKYPRWKNYLKGIYDVEKEYHKFLVTGSTRLDLYRRGQDSMFGRYTLWRLHPFCLAELNSLKIDRRSPDERLKLLLIHSGFPEPYLACNEKITRRWRLERLDLVFRQDIREIEKIKDIYLLEQLHNLLKAQVSGQINYANLARDMDVTPKTIKSWIQVLEHSYALFQIRPYAAKLARSILKQPKIYFYDNGDVDRDEGAKFENLVANHLLKRIQYLQDGSGHRYELCYLRDKEKHEVDFVIVKDKKPVALVEAKWSDTSPHHDLTYFGDRLGVKTRIQLVAEGAQKKTHKGCVVWPAAEWLSQPLSKDLFD